MTQHFLETSTNQPELFTFKQTFLNAAKLDLNDFVERFQANFELQQEQCWLEYWQKFGEQLTLQQWNLKYRDYLDVEPNREIETAVQQEQREVNINEGVNEEIEELYSEQHNERWQQLWQEHSAELYLEQYNLFATINYNYFVDLKRSLENDETYTELVESSDELSCELDQLRLLGLPTAFGGRTRANTKKKQKILEPSQEEQYSIYFSEEETEDMGKIAVNKTDKDNDDLHGVQSKTIIKKNNRKLRNVPKFVLEEKGMLKYWRKRFSLFSRFDEGIRLDRESWFSVTPEKIAIHLAERLACDILIDGFCGSGGNAIQFAKTCSKVIAVDIDAKKLEMAKHNAGIYGVAHKIDFIHGDFLQLSAAGQLKCDIVFLSPPWGGPKYKKKTEYDIDKFLIPVGATKLMDVARNLSENVALFLPRNSNMQQIIKLAGVGKNCEVEHSYLDTRLVAITALYGDTILSKANEKVQNES